MADKPALMPAEWVTDQRAIDIIVGLNGLQVGDEVRLIDDADTLRLLHINTLRVGKVCRIVVLRDPLGASAPKNDPILARCNMAEWNETDLGGAFILTRTMIAAWRRPK